MKKIAYLAPSEEKLAHIKTLLREYDSEILFETGSLVDGVSKAKTLIKQGIDVIIARGETAYNIRDTYPEVAVVDVPISGFDLALALEKARTYGGKVAVVSFASMIKQVECLESALGVQIKKYYLHSRDEVAAVIDQAVREGANVILGGYSTGVIAVKKAVPFVEIYTGDQAYVETFYAARSLLKTIELERRKTAVIKAVLDNAYEGILSIDDKGFVHSINPVAQRILKCRDLELNRVPISDLWPELGLEQVLNTGNATHNQFYKMHESQLLCNKVPIKDRAGRVIGAVATFQETTKIQKMESRIRKEFYAKGHVAHYHFSDIVARDALTKNVLEMAKSYAGTDAGILITGETGVGKEVFAQSIHNAGRRAKGPFVAVNCAALPAQLLESELFGYVGGAFTGANKEGKPGLFEVAHTGTIFLDEIGEMDYANQGRLLRVLQERSIMRLGSDRVIPVDVRVIAATNKNLRELIGLEKFREDLYYRLNVLKLQILPLRQRKKDIAQYARQMLAQLGADTDKQVRLSVGAAKVLERYTWPGNIRELRNVMERALAIGARNVINAAFMERILNSDGMALGDSSQTSETERIQQALTACDGKIAEAAERLKITRVTLWRKMKKLNISK